MDDCGRCDGDMVAYQPLDASHGTISQNNPQLNVKQNQPQISSINDVYRVLSQL